MSSQKYGKLVLTGVENNEQAYVWHCKIDKEECVFTSFSNNKPMCERCPVAKDYKAKVKRGKMVMQEIVEAKKNENLMPNSQIKHPLY